MILISPIDHPKVLFCILIYNLRIKWDELRCVSKVKWTEHLPYTKFRQFLENNVCRLWVGGQDDVVKGCHSEKGLNIMIMGHRSQGVPEKYQDLNLAPTYSDRR